MAQAWRRSVGVLLLLGALLAAPGTLAQKITLVAAPPVAFGFSELQSREHADALVDLGQLVKIYIWPTELGGEDAVRNIVYVTPEAAEARAAIVGDLRRFLHGDEETEVEILPEYKGASIVPTRIRFTARHKQGGAPFERVVEVWH
jgi:hypothetical protein